MNRKKVSKKNSKIYLLSSILIIMIAAFISLFFYVNSYGQNNAEAQEEPCVENNFTTMSSNPEIPDGVNDQEDKNATTANISGTISETANPYGNFDGKYKIDVRKYDFSDNEGATNLDGQYTVSADNTWKTLDAAFTKPGKYQYTVTQVNTGLANFTYENISYTVTFDVDDDLNVSKTIIGKDQQKVDQITFANTYAPANNLSYAIDSPIKTNYSAITGRDIKYVVSWNNTEGAKTINIENDLSAGLTYKDGSASVAPTVEGQKLKWAIQSQGKDYGIITFTATVSEGVTSLDKVSNVYVGFNTLENYVPPTRHEVDDKDKSGKITTQFFNYTDDENLYKKSDDIEGFSKNFPGSVNNNGLFAGLYNTSARDIGTNRFTFRSGSTRSIDNVHEVWSDKSEKKAINNNWDADSYVSVKDPFTRTTGNAYRIHFAPNLENAKSVFGEQIKVPSIRTFKNGYTDFANEKAMSLGYLFGADTNANGETPQGVRVYKPLQDSYLRNNKVFDEYRLSTSTIYDTRINPETKEPIGLVTGNGIDFNYENDKSQPMFKVWDQPIRTQTTADMCCTSQTNFYWDAEGEDYGDILPFNHVNPTPERYQRSAAGSKEHTEAKNFFYDTVWGTTDYWFGQKTEFNFFQEEKGIHKYTYNGKEYEHPMSFQFSGDDDVAVYVDDVLIIDLGGTHGRAIGFVNFTEGKNTEANVESGIITEGLAWQNTKDAIDGYRADPECYTGTYTDSSGKEHYKYDLTLRKRFEQAYKAQGKTTEEINKLLDEKFGNDSNGNPRQTFKDNTMHKMTIFYLDRGMAVSNCNMQINLGVAKQGSINLVKEWDENDNLDRPDSVEFVLEQSESTKPNEWKEYGTYSLSGDENEKIWTQEINGLPMEVDGGPAYRYRVKEKPTVDKYKTNDPVYKDAAGQQKAVNYILPTDKSKGATKLESATITNVQKNNNLSIPIQKTTASTHEIPFDTNEWTFQIKAVDGAPMPSENTTTIETTKIDKKLGSFKPITFTEEGTYKYTIEEILSEDVSASGNWKTSPSKYEITVVTKRDANEKLVASYQDASGQPIAAPFNFTNTYKPTPVITKISGTKAYKDKDNKDLPIPENAFVVNVSGTSYSEDVNVSSNDWKSGDIKFDTAGSYEFKVTEQFNGQWGIKYDPAVYTIQFDVIDVAGNLKIDKTTIKKDGTEANAIEFTNYYKPPVKEYNSADVSDGSLLQPGDTVSYKLTGGNYSSKPASIQVYDTLSQGLSVLVSDIVVPDGFTKSVEGQKIVIQSAGTVPVNYEFVITYKATVTEDAYKNADCLITNSYSLGFDGKEARFVNSKTNVVPHKDYNPDGSTLVDHNGQQVAVGGEIGYKICTSNATDSETNFEFVDSINAGLKYVEGSFEFNGGSVADPEWIKDTQGTIVGFKYSTPQIDPEQSATLTYKCETLENPRSYDMTVTNSATVSGKATNTLINAVPYKASEFAQGSSHKDGETIKFHIYSKNVGDDGSKAYFTDETSDGLELNLWDLSQKPAPVLVHLNYFDTAGHPQQYIYTDDEIQCPDIHHFSILPSETSPKIAKDTVFDLEYQCKISSKAYETNQVSNKATSHMNTDIPVELLPVKYNVPQVTYNDDHTYGQTVKVGDQIKYKISGTNVTDNDCKITLEDNPQQGLMFVNGTFELHYVDINGEEQVKEYEDASDFDLLEPYHFKLTTPEVQKDSSYYLEYTCMVKGNSPDSHLVNNQASIKVGDTNQLALNPLYNAVAEKIFGDEHSSGQSLNVGDKLTYKIASANANDNAIKAHVTDSLSNGLSLDQSSIKLSYQSSTGESAQYTYTKDDFAKIDEHGFETKDSSTCPNIPKHTEYYFTYTATVTDAAYSDGHQVHNDAKVDACELPSLTNDVPQKKYNDDRVAGEVVHVGDTIAYSITSSNQTGNNATVVFADELSAGLEYVDDSFYFDGKKVDVKYEDNKFTWTSPEVLPDKEFSLTYKATVTEAAYKTNWVKNDASINIAETGIHKLKALPNAVPQKTYQDPKKEQGYPVAVGDTIDYQIEVSNPFNDQAVPIKFEDEMTPGLKIMENSFKLNGEPLKGKVEYGESPAGGMKFTYVTPEAVPAKEKLVLSYSASVVEGFEGYKVNNDAFVTIGNTSRAEVNALPNTVPLKEYADGHNNGDVLNVGDIVAYKISLGNYTGSDAYFTFSDTLTGGLEYLADSFKLKINDKEVSVKPEINANTFTFKAEEIPNDANVVLTYKCRVTEEAYKTLKVQNSAQIGINADPNFKLNILSNSVNPAPVVPEQTSKTGDMLIWLLLGLTACLAASCLAIKLRSRRK